MHNSFLLLINTTIVLAIDRGTQTRITIVNQQLIDDDIAVNCLFIMMGKWIKKIKMKIFFIPIQSQNCITDLHFFLAFHFTKY